MRVEDDVRHEAGLGPRHVLGGPEHGADALLPGPAGKLVANRWVPFDAQSDAHAPLSRLGRPEHPHRVNVGHLGPLVLGHNVLVAQNRVEAAKEISKKN